MTAVEVDEDTPEVDVPIGNTLVVGDPAEEGDICPGLRWKMMWKVQLQM
jgi:hypothetical protein